MDYTSNTNIPYNNNQEKYEESISVLEQLIENRQHEPAFSPEYYNNIKSGVTYKSVKMINEYQCSTEVEINNNIIVALIDSGATNNYMSEGLYEKLKDPSNDQLRASHGSVTVGNNQSIPIFGVVTMVVSLQNIDYKVQFHVLKGPLSSNLVLGWKGFIIPNKIILNGSTISLELPIPATERGAVYLKETENLSPFSEKLVTVNLKYPEGKTKDIFVDKFQVLLDRTGVTVSPGIQERTFPQREIESIRVVLTNLTANTVRLPENTIIAFATAYESEEMPDPNISKKVKTNVKTNAPNQWQKEDRNVRFNSETSYINQLKETVEKSIEEKIEKITYDIKNDKLTDIQIEEFKNLCTKMRIFLLKELDLVRQLEYNM